MNGGRANGSSTKSLDRIRRLVAACDRFEADWRAGRPADLDAYLGEVDEAERPELLRELQALEQELRSTRPIRAEAPAPDTAGPVQPTDSARAPDGRGDTTLPFDASPGVDEPGPDADPPATALSPRRAVAEASTIPERRGDEPRGRLPPRGDRSEAGWILGDYELLERIGRGGMGIVYRAHQRSASRIVALKLIKPDWLDAMPEDRGRLAVERFQIEARAAARLSHENIVTVYEVGVADGRHFYSMRYVEGRGLDDYLRQGPLTPREAAKILEPVARAVHHAHERGILHRDLKPSNILIDTQGVPYVTDFGLAKLLEGTQQLTRTQALMGSPPYMSPEQARDAARVEAASDVYSLGATLYEMLTGRPPFQAADPLETLRQVIEEDPASPSRLNPGIDRDLERVCLKCLEKEPARRYATARDLADDLARYLRGETVHARPIRAWERLRRWIRRRPAVAALIAVSAVASLALVGVIVAQLYNARLARALADAELSSRQARSAVNLLVDLSEKTLVDEPGLQPLRKRLLSATLPFYRDFLLRSENDAALRAELAATHLRVAKISELIGAPAEALEAYRRSQALCDALTREHPRSAAYANDLAECVHGQAIALRALGRPEESLAAYRQARALRERILAEHPADPKIESDLARTYGYLGDIELETGRLEAASESYRRSHAIRERIASASPTPEARFELARSHENLGRIFQATGDSEAARRHYALGRDLQEALVRESARNPRFQADLGRTQYRLGLLLAGTGRTSEALDSLEQARILQQRLITENPDVAPYKTALARTATEIGRLENAAGQCDAARTVSRTAIDLLRQVGSESGWTPELLSDLARAWNTLARAQESLGEPDEARAGFRLAVEHQRTALERAGQVTSYREHLESYRRDLERLEESS